MKNNWNGRHEHVFGQNEATPNEHRTLIVVIITAITMFVEISAGMVYGSMALLADGLHMASHAVALGIVVIAYRYARKHATDPSFSFGTGKINSLAGFSGAILLGVFAIGMAGESIERFINPVDIAFNQAIFVAVLGLLVNGFSVLILGIKNHHHDHEHEDGHTHHHHDHNFRSAYLHVIADALTSLLAIGALLSGKYFGQSWLDPMMGVVGAIIVARWSIGLLRESSQVLLDKQAPNELLDEIRAAIEGEADTKVTDLHVWSIGPGKKAAIIAIESKSQRDAEDYHSMLQDRYDLSHLTIEVWKQK